MMIINQQLVSNVADGAGSSARLRKNYNFHSDYADPVNRMLNALEPGTYIRPHKHESPDKCEVFIILTGKALAVRFDGAGEILDHAVLDHANGIYGIEFAPREWHTILSLAPGTVLYEVKPGPYAPIADKNFAPWAPAEGSPETAAYMKSLLAAVGLAADER
ncbi:MAG: WbuC family cupin fold metalloprotein [Acidobacteria bacterium]|nr:WbuC family cupin fold metalloprotein [Acidobacteriota bacterium]